MATVTDQRNELAKALKASLKLHRKYLKDAKEEALKDGKSMGYMETPEDKKDFENGRWTELVGDLNYLCAVEVFVAKWEIK